MLEISGVCFSRWCNSQGAHQKGGKKDSIRTQKDPLQFEIVDAASHHMITISLWSRDILI
jgi:hypothetical protein